MTRPYGDSALRPGRPFSGLLGNRRGASRSCYTLGGVQPSRLNGAGGSLPAGLPVP